MEELHKPVLITEVLEVLNPQPGESYLDLTAGYGGHASEVLDLTRNYKDSVLIDRDEFAVEYLKGKYKSEPLEIVNINNEITALKVEENDEVRRILKELTSLCLLQ